MGEEDFFFWKFLFVKIFLFRQISDHNILPSYHRPSKKGYISKLLAAFNLHIFRQLFFSQSLWKLIRKNTWMLFFSHFNDHRKEMMQQKKKSFVMSVFSLFLDTQKKIDHFSKNKEVKHLLAAKKDISGHYQRIYCASLEDYLL